ncbi:hypothetical protein C0991_000798 [Blastosporella zonata]|nr:hypothetical protein C0991_000798 [Blastosporella zonata]
MDPLEKMFQKLEEESEQRAREDAGKHVEAKEVKLVGMSSQVKIRRRGSISITRFGQLADQSSKASSSGTHTPTLSTIASNSAFYQLQSAPSLKNNSSKSFASGASAHLDEDAHQEEDHATQMLHIAGRQTISKAVGNFLPRRLSRARSANILVADANVVIGVSVEEATVVFTGGAEAAQTVVHAPGALRNQPSRLTMAGSSPARSSWVHKAKSFALKLRRKSKDIESSAR